SLRRQVKSYAHTAWGMVRAPKDARPPREADRRFLIQRDEHGQGQQFRDGRITPRSATLVPHSASKNAPGARRGSVTQNFRARGRVGCKEVVDDLFDLLGLMSVPMTQAVQRRFLARQRIEREDGSQRFECLPLHFLEVEIIGAAERGKRIPPHVAAPVERRAAGLVEVRENGSTADGEQSREEREGGAA